MGNKSPTHTTNTPTKTGEQKMPFKDVEVGQAFIAEGLTACFIKTTKDHGFAINAPYPMQYRFYENDNVVVVKYEFYFSAGK
jgi:hypothetical protein